MVSKEMVGGVPEGHAWSMVPKKDMVDDVQEDIKDSTITYTPCTRQNRAAASNH